MGKEAVKKIFFKMVDKNNGKSKKWRSQKVKK